MDKPAFTSHGRDIATLRNATSGTGMMAGRSAKAESKRTMKEQDLSWESAFHADRGCLGGGLPLQYTGPQQHH